MELKLPPRAWRPHACITEATKLIYYPREGKIKVETRGKLPEWLLEFKPVTHVTTGRDYVPMKILITRNRMVLTFKARLVEVWHFEDGEVYITYTPEEELKAGKVTRRAPPVVYTEVTGVTFYPEEGVAHVRLFRKYPEEVRVKRIMSDHLPLAVFLRGDIADIDIRLRDALDKHVVVGYYPEKETLVIMRSGSI